jgi:hypothetical protein
MDAERFDSLTKRLADPQSRRRLLRGMGVGAGAAALAALSRKPGAAAPNACAQACAFEPKGPRQAACKQACKRCDGNLNQVCFGNQITCCARGECCFDEQTENVTCSTQLPACPEPLVREGCACVCPDSCGAGQFPDPDQDCACVPFPTCDAGGAPEDCEVGVVADCGADDLCACVENVDGGTVCVERVCTFVECSSEADCDNGPCVSIPGCCDPNPTCAVPCGASGAGSRSRGRASGWG